jgi:hypothetical protein
MIFYPFVLLACLHSKERCMRVCRPPSQAGRGGMVGATLQPTASTFWALPACVGWRGAQGRVLLELAIGGAVTC